LGKEVAVGQDGQGGPGDAVGISQDVGQRRGGVLQRIGAQGPIVEFAIIVAPKGDGVDRVGLVKGHARIIGIGIADPALAVAIEAVVEVVDRVGFVTGNDVLGKGRGAARGQGHVVGHHRSASLFQADQRHPGVAPLAGQIGLDFVPLGRRQRTVVDDHLGHVADERILAVGGP